MSQTAATKKRAVEIITVWFRSLHGDRLHFLPEADRRGKFWERTAEEGTVKAKAACGLSARWWTPGFMSRMFCQRCSRCCAEVGIPVGRGTPANWPAENGHNPTEDWS